MPAAHLRHHHVGEQQVNDVCIVVADLRRLGAVPGAQDLVTARLEDQLRQLAHYDQLTGLPNRTMLQQELRRLLTKDDGKAPTSVVLFDLDEFKDVNDTLGHSTGDQLLVEVGRRLVGVAEERAIVGLASRLGGDEFVLILPDCGDPRSST